MSYSTNRHINLYYTIYLGTYNLPELVSVRVQVPFPVPVKIIGTSLLLLLSPQTNRRNINGLKSELKGGRVRLERVIIVCCIHE